MQRKGTYTFDVFSQKNLLQQVHLPLGGMHNVENAVAAIAACLEVGADPVQLKRALEDFAGIRAPLSVSGKY